MSYRIGEVSIEHDGMPVEVVAYEDNFQIIPDDCLYGCTTYLWLHGINSIDSLWPPNWFKTRQQRVDRLVAKAVRQHRRHVSRRIDQRTASVLEDLRKQS